MEIRIPEDFKTRFPDTSVTLPKDGLVRILCSSHPIYAAETVEKVAAEIMSYNPHLERFSLTRKTDRHGRMEALLIFKER